MTSGLWLGWGGLAGGGLLVLGVHGLCLGGEWGSDSQRGRQGLPTAVHSKGQTRALHRFRLVLMQGLGMDPHRLAG